MRTVAVDVVGGDVHEVTVADDATYADLLAAVDLSVHEATALVDERPVPADDPVGDADAVRVLRLVKGGDADPAVAVRVRRAAPDDVVPILRVVEGALLDVDAPAVRDRVAAGEALVATRSGHVVGALVRDGERVVAVAVTRAWRREGIGRALVDRALADAGRLVATADGRVRGFYEACGFDVTRRADGRFEGVRRTA